MIEEVEPKDFRKPVPDSALLTKGFAQLPKVLGQMGFQSLRPGQDQIVNRLLAGVDTLAVMPTSAGKSACFVIPAMCHDWRLLVFSPLKALMADQVRGLEAKGIVALSLSSDQQDQINQRNLGDWLDGNCKILFVAPERLANQEFMQVMRSAPPDMVAVDEMHVLSAWTDSFRHNYVHIGTLIESLRPRVVVGLTATYSKEIDSDVRRVLRVPEANLMAFYPRRENLHLSSGYRTEEEHDLAERVAGIDGSVLIYCDARARVEFLAQDLSRSLGETVGLFHAGVNTNVKKEMQRMFFNGDIRVMTATNAFGMGIDKPDIRSVIHYDHPADPEALSQEIGRAGRDGKASWCHAYMSDRAASMCRRRINSNHPTPEKIHGFHQFLRRKADSQGIVDASPGEVQAALRISEYDYAPLMELFLGSGVLVEATGVTRMHRVRFNPKLECESKPFRELRKALASCGELDPERRDGTIRFDLDVLCDKLSTSHSTVRKNLNGWRSDGILWLESPGKAKPKKLVGGMDLVDIDRIQAKRKLAFEKLEVVLGYFHVDDAEKHEYLEEYFTAFTR